MPAKKKMGSPKMKENEKWSWMLGANGRMQPAVLSKAHR
jgi:hypothetical protein